MTQQTVAPGSILLHIGPHKTGTTALQSGAASRRPQLAAEGVTYPLHKGKDHHSAAAMAAGGRKWGWVDRGGHYVPEEEPFGLAEAVLPFLKQRLPERHERTTGRLRRTGELPRLEE